MGNDSPQAAYDFRLTKENIITMGKNGCLYKVNKKSDDKEYAAKVFNARINAKSSFNMDFDEKI
jgi:hypothetical protein